MKKNTERRPDHLVAKPEYTVEKLKCREMIWSVVFKNGKHDIAELTCNGANGSEMVLALCAFFLIEGREHRVMECGN